MCGQATDNTPMAMARIPRQSKAFETDESIKLLMTVLVWDCDVLVDTRENIEFLLEVLVADCDVAVG